MMSYTHDSDETDEVLELRQAIIDLFLYIQHDKTGRWVIQTFQGYVMPELSAALDEALRLAIKQR